MLPRALNEIYESMRDFSVYEENGELIGTVALHINWEDLAELRSLAVKEEYMKKGIGAKLVTSCLKEAKELGIARVFALTYQPEFFKKQGFKEIDKTQLPQKIWTDCLKCYKFPDCNEVALIIELQSGGRM